MSYSFVLKCIFLIVIFNSVPVICQWQYYGNLANGQPLHSVFFLNENIGWVGGGSGSLFRTENGGLTWFEVTSNTSNSIGCVIASNDSTVWIFGSFGMIRKSTNKGLTWQVVTSPTTQTIHEAHFVSNSVAYGSADNGVIVKTTNGGNTWFTQQTGVNYSLHCVRFVDEEIGWAVGSSGIILKTTNGGSNWYAQSNTPISTYYWAVHPISELVCWVVGDQGAVKSTTDGGLTWSINFLGNERLRYVYFYDEDFGWLIGGSGTMFKTFDGGNSWIIEPAIVQNDLLCMHFGANNRGWATTISGSMIKYIGMPLSLGENYKILEFSLGQNYPNPFNPFTYIPFTLTRSSDAELYIYNILGEQVHSERYYNFSAGEHFALFSPLNLSSGVYYYRLVVDDQSITRKMIYLK